MVTEEGKKYKLCNEEIETVISYNNAGKVATIYTCNPTKIKQLDKLCKTGQYVCVKKDEWSKTYEVDKKQIRFATKRTMTEEQRQKASDRFAEIKAKMKDKVD